MKISSVKNWLKIIVHMVLTAIFFSALPASAMENPLAGLDAYVKAAMEQQGVPGLAIAIVKDDKVVLAKGYGTRTVGKDQLVDENTVFAIGSQTKTFTATALAMLVGEGKINWDDLMLERLPGFQVGDALATSRTTIRDALSHRSGIEPGDITLRTRVNLGRKERLGLMKYLKLEQPFRAGFVYNNFMYLAAGEVIPAAIGVSWDDFVENRIFEPLGMKNSATDMARVGRNKNVATAHKKLGDHIIPISHPDYSGVAPAGSIVSTAVDMAQWLRFQLNNGKVGNRQLVSEEALVETRRTHAQLSDEYVAIMMASGLARNVTGYGLGIGITDSAGYKVLSHGGNTGGMKSYGAFIPELDLGVVVLANAGIEIALPLTAWIVDRYTGAKEVDWVSSYHKTLDELASKDGRLVSLKENSIKNTTPSLPLSHYAGVYTNDLVGKLVVLAKKDGLSFKLGGNITGTLDHLHFDTFLIEVTSPLGTFTRDYNDGVMQFSLNTGGSIKSLTTGGITYSRLSRKE